MYLSTSLVVSRCFKMFQSFSDFLPTCPQLTVELTVTGTGRREARPSNYLRCLAQLDHFFPFRLRRTFLAGETWWNSHSVTVSSHLCWFIWSPLFSLFWLYSTPRSLCCSVANIDHKVTGIFGFCWSCRNQETYFSETGEDLHRTGYTYIQYKIYII